MYQLSANIELLFTEAGENHADRIRAAADAGIFNVEIWRTSDKDLKGLQRALQETGSKLWTLVVEPRTHFNHVDDLQPFYAGLRQSIEVAKDLNCERIVVTSGMGNPGRKRATQLDRIATILAEAAQIVEGSGITLLLENVNTRVDHPGSLIDLSTECAEVVRRVGSPSVAMLYDMYHSVIMGEDTKVSLIEAAALVSHVQIADTEGRGEPGSGSINWPDKIKILEDVGYSGPLGLEYYPTKETIESISYIRDLVARV